MANVVPEGSAWWDISWVDWIAVVGTLLALFGIWQAWRQAGKAVTASKAAASAASATRRQLQANQLLVLIPQLRWLYTELDSAIRDDDALYCGRVLNSWRFQANAVRGVLGTSGEVDGSLVLIQKSVAQAATATDKLLDNSYDVRNATRQARRAIGLVCDDLTVWSGKTSISPNAQGADEQ